VVVVVVAMTGIVDIAGNRVAVRLVARIKLFIAVFSVVF
jgi:hypothetical protein